MAVSYDGTTQTARMNATLTRIDNHASPATLEICTAAYAAVLVSIILSDPSFTVGGTPSVLTMNPATMPRSGVATGTGSAALARIKDGGGVVIVNNLTVGITPVTFDIVLNSVSISSGQTVTLTHPSTITHSS